MVCVPVLLIILLLHKCSRILVRNAMRHRRCEEYDAERKDEKDEDETASATANNSPAQTHAQTEQQKE